MCDMGESQHKSLKQLHIRIWKLQNVNLGIKLFFVPLFIYQ